jgi:very-short-patch-repair endonuclease
MSRLHTPFWGTQLRKKLRNNATMAEIELWRAVKGKQLLGIKFRRQHGVGSFVVDFYAVSIKLAIEVDGQLHNDERAIKYDARRTEYLNENGITMLRFMNQDVYHHLEEVIDKIKSVIVSLQVHPLHNVEGLGEGTIVLEE